MDQLTIPVSAHTGVAGYIDLYGFADDITVTVHDDGKVVVAAGLAPTRVIDSSGDWNDDE